MTAKPQHANDRPDNPDVLHEKSDVGVRGIVLFAGALIVGAVVIHIVVWLLFVAFGRLNAGQFPRQYPMAPTGVLRLPPAPRLQEKPREDLKELRRREDAVLRQYGWADENAGTARVPVEEAMRRVLAQGLPSAPASPDAPRDDVRPSDASSGRWVEEGR